MKTAHVTWTKWNHFLQVEIDASEKSADISKIRGKKIFFHVPKGNLILGKVINFKSIPLAFQKLWHFLYEEGSSVPPSQIGLKSGHFPHDNTQIPRRKWMQSVVVAATRFISHEPVSLWNTRDTHQFCGWVDNNAWVRT